ncbi:MAG: hypothetical protein HQK89_04865 [Nitrospirae bacterium]|nr:hypothetical protein [Nitrospirota bacterium]
MDDHKGEAGEVGCACNAGFQGNLAEKIDPFSLSDCPQCGLKFDNPAELFYHLLVFHSG